MCMIMCAHGDDMLGWFERGVDEQAWVSAG